MTNLNRYSEDNHTVVIALGDPAGIGIEITLKALTNKSLPYGIKPVLVGCEKTLKQTYIKLIEKTTASQIANPSNYEIVDIPTLGKINPGQPNSISGDASFRSLTTATKLVMNNHRKALVTAPIAKKAWAQAGHIYPGQTERLAELAGAKNPGMLFTAVSPHNGWRLNTLLATTHIPLYELNKALTPELIYTKLNSLFEFCNRFKDLPTIAIAGINPHAGEAGHIGSEEIEWLIPLIKQWQKIHPQIKLIGPLPPDTCWLSSAKAWRASKQVDSPDGILAMYHDQGLTPVKLIAFEEAVNTTLGLPFIRTSPDHGTAFDIAGKGLARPTSMLAAIQTAWDLSKSNTQDGLTRINT